MGDKAIEFTGEQVKALRSKHKLTQEQFASRLGVTRQALNNYETGYRNPPKAMIMHMMSVYGVATKYKRSSKNNN